MAGTSNVSRSQWALIAVLVAASFVTLQLIVMKLPLVDIGINSDEGKNHNRDRLVDHDAPQSVRGTVFDRRAKKKRSRAGSDGSPQIESIETLKADFDTYVTNADDEDQTQSKRTRPAASTGIPKEKNDNAASNNIQKAPVKRQKRETHKHKRNSTQGSAAMDPPTENNEDGHTTQTKEEGKKKLNVLLLYPDDWRHDTIGGVAPVVRTPFLNELAREGIRFTHNCVTTSICWISRATLFSGQYAARHKSFTLGNPAFTKNFHNETWAGILQQQYGYHTAHVGKWQYGNKEGLPTTREVFNYTRISGARHWATRNGKRMHDSDIARDDALEFLETRPKDKPFAMTVAFYPPKAVGVSTEPGGQWYPKNDTMHLFVNETIPPPRDDVKESFKRLPYFFNQEGPARSRYRQRFSTPERYQGAMKNYYRLVYTVDEACRVLVDKLKEQGEYDNTLIIFTTDNGLFHGEHGLAGKWYPYQESIRVPLIIRDPRMPKEKWGTLDDSFTLNIDLAETILGAAGAPPAPVMQGRDMSDLYLKGKSTSSDRWRDEFYYEWTPEGEKKDFPVSTALVRKSWKYIHWPQFEYEQLFDMVNDPLEENDVAKDAAKNETLASIMKEMRERHNELREKVK